MTDRAIGVDVGGTKIAAGVVDRNGKILKRVERPTPKSSQDEFLALLDELVASLRDDEVAAVGFGMPSTIDQRSGRVVSSVHIPLGDFDFRSHMADRIGLPVALDNDGNAAAIAEWKAGAGHGASDMIMLTLGTGVGGGLILGGKPYRGFMGAGAEIGHMVLEYGGEPCAGNCTGHGHLEQVASGGAADRLAAKILGPGMTGRELVGAARDGNEEALEAIVGIGRRLGAAIGSLVNIFNPEVVVIGGGFSQARDLFLEPALESMREEALVPGRDLVRVVPALLGPDAGLVGAGFVGFEAV
ncbi:MAG TPA: ROK family protein [Gaiellaceae bacterium]